MRLVYYILYTVAYVCVCMSVLILSLATSTLLGYHVGLVRDQGGVSVDLDHAQVLVRHGHTAEGAIQRLSALQVAVQQDGMVVTAEQRETTCSFTVVDVGCGRIQQVLLQRHSETLQVTMINPCWFLLPGSGRSLSSLYGPSIKHSL